MTAAFIFICPNTRLRVQGFTAEDTSARGTFVPVRCLACTATHYVNPSSGKVLGAETQPAASI
jgi:hypothetical protein